MVAAGEGERIPRRLFLELNHHERSYLAHRFLVRGLPRGYSFWDLHFLSYNKYTSIAARAVRASLKEESRVTAEKRGVTTLRYQKWENGVGSEQVHIPQCVSLSDI